MSFCLVIPQAGNDFRPLRGEEVFLEHAFGKITKFLLTHSLDHPCHAGSQRAKKLLVSDQLELSQGEKRQHARVIPPDSSFIASLRCIFHQPTTILGGVERSVTVK